MTGTDLSAGLVTLEVFSDNYLWLTANETFTLELELYQVDKNNTFLHEMEFFVEWTDPCVKFPPTLTYDAAVPKVTYSVIDPTVVYSDTVTFTLFDDYNCTVTFGDVFPTSNVWTSVPDEGETNHEYELADNDLLKAG